MLSDLPPSAAEYGVERGAREAWRLGGHVSVVLGRTAIRMTNT